MTGFSMIAEYRSLMNFGGVCYGLQAVSTHCWPYRTNNITGIPQCGGNSSETPASCTRGEHLECLNCPLPQNFVASPPASPESIPQISSFSQAQRLVFLTRSVFAYASSSLWVRNRPTGKRIIRSGVAPISCETT
jgi:hypothetical protein